GCGALAWKSAPKVQLAGVGVEQPPAEMPIPPPETAASSSQAITAKPPPSVGPKPPIMGPGKKKRKGKPGAPAPTASTQAAPQWVEAPPSDDITVWRRLRWILLAAIPSSLMLGTTTLISVDLSPIPLLWIVPLALYLLSFILVFLRWPVPWTRGPHSITVIAQPIFVLVLALILATGRVTGHEIHRAIGMSLLAFFTTALVCHGELARDRPTARRLTEFYLWMSVGGMLGGVFNALCAPVLFTGVVEYPVALVLACML